MSVNDQRTQALHDANQVRTGGAEFKRELAALGMRDARLFAADTLRDGAASIGAMRIHTFLECVPRAGDVRVRQWLQGEGVWPLKRVRELTDRQRWALSRRLVSFANHDAANLRRAA